MRGTIIPWAEGVSKLYDVCKRMIQVGSMLTTCVQRSYYRLAISRAMVRFTSGLTNAWPSTPHWLQPSQQGSPRKTQSPQLPHAWRRLDSFSGLFATLTLLQSRFNEFGFNHAQTYHRCCHAQCQRQPSQIRTWQSSWPGCFLEASAMLRRWARTLSARPSEVD